MSLLTDELRSWIGRTATYTSPEPIGRASIRLFCMAIEEDNPIYRDDEAARAAGYPGVVAPPTFVCETCQYAEGPPDEDGYIGHLWELPVEGCRALRGGQSYEFGRPLTPDDILTVTWEVVDITERPSRTSGTMLRVQIDAVYTNQHNEFLARNSEMWIYQPLGDRA